MKTLITPKGGQVRVSDEVAEILTPLGYKEPVVEESPAPQPTPKKAPAKRAPRKTSTKKEA
ncbi:hypothetical protein D3C74_465900 [compost metagenome]